MSRFWSPHIRTLKPYVAGEQAALPGLVKLNTNENPYGPAPEAVRAIKAAADDGLRLYPDPHARDLKRCIAAHHGVRPEQVFVGNGSDEVLAHAFMALLRHDLPVLFPDVSYSFYPVYCALYGIDYRPVPVTASFEIDVARYGEACGGIVLPNPNAPTGIALPRERIEQLLLLQPARPVVVDEAYVDFGTESAVGLIDRYPQLLVVQTLSKSRGLAGLRVGYALGSEELVEGLERVKGCFNSYPLDRVAMAGAMASFAADDHFRTTCQRIVHSRRALTADLTRLGFEVLPSHANFVFTTHPAHDAAALAGRLRAQSILVRHFPHPRTERFLRITVGTDAECRRLIDVLRAILPGAHQARSR